MRRLAALLLLLVLPALAVGDEPGADWPFGVPAAERVSMRKRDLYNLGVLGAKARDPDRPESVFEGGGRRQVKVDRNDTGADDGPPRFRIEILYPDGPAAKAGLAIGDVVTAVNGRKLDGIKGGSLAAFAKALTDAEAGKGKGVVKLHVERRGAKDPVALDVQIPVVGKDAEKPNAGPMREKLVAAAAEFLAARQQSDGGFPETLSGANGAVVQTSVAGLVWLACGSDLRTGPYAERLRKAAEFVSLQAGTDDFPSGAGGGTNMSQVNWGLAHAAIFLGELQARSADDAVAATLVRVAEALVRNQEASGGWAHGPGGPNALGYVELNIVTGLAMCGLGMARRADWEPPAEVLRKAEDYLEKSSSGDGGVGYSDKPGQVGMGNIGRTAISWLGALSLGQRNAPFAKKMESYVRSHAGEVFGGHASLMEHYFHAGVAASAQGGDALSNYWDTCLRDLVLARGPDGSFQPRPFHESLAMGSNSDVSFGDVWTTACWAIVLACEPVKGGRPGLPAWLGRLPPPLPKKK